MNGGKLSSEFCVYFRMSVHYFNELVLWVTVTRKVHRYLEERESFSCVLLACSTLTMSPIKSV